MTTSSVLRRTEERRRTGVAVLLSLAVHLVAILLVAWIYVMEITPPPPPGEDIEIVFLDAPEVPTPPMFVDSSAPATEPPEVATFEADRDSVAAAMEAPQGDQPVPTQDGREQTSLELEDRELALAQMQETTPAPEAPQPSEPTPPDVAEQPAEPLEVAEQEQEPLEPEPEALLAMAEPVREPVPTPPPRPAPAVPPSARPAYRPQTRTTRLSGRVDNRGRSAVDSVATPLGRYRKAISDAIGSSWYHLIGPRLDMFTYGTMSVVFVIDPDGQVRRPRVISNTSNESFEIITLESILAAEIPPIPPDVLPTLEGGQIEVDYSFSIITN